MLRQLAAAAGPALLILGACQSTPPASSYSVGAVGVAARTYGVLLSAQDVTTNVAYTGAGAGAGAIAGGVAGSHVGGTTGSAVSGSIGGIVIGSAIGAAIEAAATRRQQVEYVVQCENGAFITVVQDGPLSLRPNQKVVVIYGTPVLVAADYR